MSLVFRHSPCEVLRRILIGLGAGADPPARPWPIFVGNEPTDPDDCLTLYDTQGTSDGRSMLGGELYEHYGFQLRVRARDHPTGAAKAHAVRRIMAEGILMIMISTANGSVTYLLHSVNRLGGVISLGKEVPTSKRHLFTVNGTLALRRHS